MRDPHNIDDKISNRIYSLFNRLGEEIPRGVDKIMMHNILNRMVSNEHACDIEGITINSQHKEILVG